MKRFAIIIAFTLLFSCADDDSSSGNGTDLKTMVTSLYGMEGTLLDRAVMEFRNNKPLRYTVYHPSGEVYRYHDYSYGPDGQLKNTQIYNSGQLAITYELEYDVQGRLTHWKSTDHLDFDDIMGGDFEYYYVHNNNNTITQVLENGSENIYYLNNAGQVYKITYGGGYTSEVTYSGNDIIEWAQPGNIGVSYFYDDTHPVKGEWRNMIKNQFRGYEANHILYGGHANAVTATDRYITRQIQNNGSVTDYAYEFNAAGYPVRVATSQNGEEPRVFVDVTYQ